MSSSEEGEVSDDETPVLQNQGNVLMVGDERADHINLGNWKNFPKQEIHTKAYATLSEVISLVDKYISNKFDFIFIFGLHWDITCIDKTESNNLKIMKLRKDVKVNFFSKCIAENTKRWKTDYPSIKVIWILPHPPDFVAYNTMLSKGRSNSIVRSIGEEKSESSKYWHIIELLGKKIKELKEQIFCFHLTDVLFFKHQQYVKSLTGLTDPKFPSGHLYQGLFFKPVTVMYFGHLMSEYLINLQKDNSPLINNLELKNARKNKEAVNSFISQIKKNNDKKSVVEELRDRFESQCDMYRINPELHPKHSSTYSEYLREVESGSINISWDKYWSEKMENYFNETWNSKLKLVKHPKASMNIHDVEDTYFENKAKSSKNNESKQDQKFSCSNACEKNISSKHKSVSSIYAKSLDLSREINTVDNSSKHSPEDNYTFKRHNNKRLKLSENSVSQSTKSNPTERTDLDLNDKGKILEKSQASNKDTKETKDLAIKSTFSSVSCETDLDSKLDALVENTSFLEDLDNELKDLLSDSCDDDPVCSKQNIAIEKTITTSEESRDSLNTLDTTEIFITNVSIYFLSVLKLLDCLSSKFGPLGLRLSNMFKLATIKHESGNDPLSILDEDNKGLLVLAYYKLDRLSKISKLTLIQKHVLENAHKELSILMTKLNISKNNNFLGVNIENIAEATRDYDTSKTLSFIKHVLLYIGYSNVKEVQLMNIYMNVKQVHLKIAKEQI